MHQLVLGLTLSFLATLSMAANDPGCEEYDQLRTQRDNALRTKNAQQYCDALAGLIKLMPAHPPGPERLKCEAKATNVNVQTWLGMRPDVVAMMKGTLDQQCR